MDAHLTTETLDRMRARLAAPGEIARAYDHVAGCDVCRLRLGAATDISSMTDSFLAGLGEKMPADAHHPLRETLIAYVGGKLGEIEREIVELHLEDCQACAGFVGQRRGEEKIINFPAHLSDLVGHRDQASAQSWRDYSRYLIAASLLLLVCGAMAAILLLRRGHDERASVAPPAVTPTSAPATPTPNKVETTTPIFPPDANTGVANAINSNSAVSPVLSNTNQHASVPTHAGNRESYPDPLLVALNDADGRIGIDKHHRLLGAENLSSHERAAIAAALTTQDIPRANSLAGLSLERGRLSGVTAASNGDKETVKPISPLGTVVRSTRPTFRWQAVPGATSYTFSILDSRFIPVGEASVQAGTEARSPVELERGKTYVWQVGAKRGQDSISSASAERPLAKFTVLSAEDFTGVQKVERENSRSHLVRGVILAQAGLLDDAEREFQLLQRANPRSIVARNLLRNLRALRPKS